MDLSKIENEWVYNKSYFSFQSMEKFLNYFFGGLRSERINGRVFGIQDTEFTDEDEKKINVLICVENCNFWKHYDHYNKYGSYGNNCINVYIYNHISRLAYTTNYIAIPTIYTQMRYFRETFECVKPTPNSNEKKFCLIATRITDGRKKMIVDTLKAIGNCDYLEDYKDVLTEKSCYHSQELLDVFNGYKYTFVAENSIQEGYVTEKIFNCFFARVIPIYSGAPDITRYFNKDSFINVTGLQDLESLKLEGAQIPCIELSSIVNPTFNDENYTEKVNVFIDSLNKTV